VGYFTKEDLLGATDLKEQDVDLPSIGGKVRVRSLPAQFSNEAQSEALEFRSVGREQVATINAAKMELLQVLHGLVNPKLNSIKDAEVFATKCGPAFKDVVNAIDDLSGVDKEAIEEANRRFQNGAGSPEREDVEAAASTDGG
jgi:hypothetical protein